MATWILVIYLMTPEGHIESAHTVGSFDSYTLCTRAQLSFGQRPDGRGPRARCFQATSAR